MSELEWWPRMEQLNRRNLVLSSSRSNYCVKTEYNAYKLLIRLFYSLNPSIEEMVNCNYVARYIYIHYKGNHIIISDKKRLKHVTKSKGMPVSSLSNVNHNLKLKNQKLNEEQLNDKHT